MSIHRTVTTPASGYIPPAPKDSHKPTSPVPPFTTPINPAFDLTKTPVTWPSDMTQGWGDSHEPSNSPPGFKR